MAGLAPVLKRGQGTVSALRTLRHGPLKLPISHSGRGAEIEWLVASVRAEITRSQGIAPESLIDDYRRALQTDEQLAATAE